jgi:hypothetical protein
VPGDALFFARCCAPFVARWNFDVNYLFSYDFLAKLAKDEFCGTRPLRVFVGGLALIIFHIHIAMYRQARLGARP